MFSLALLCIIQVENGVWLASGSIQYMPLPFRVLVGVCMCSFSPLLPSVCDVISCVGSDGHSNPSLDTVVPSAVSVDVDALLRKKRQSSSSTYFLELYVATDTAAVSSASPHA